MFTVRPSEIHGNGCFANQKLVRGNRFVIPGYRVVEETFRTIKCDDDTIWDLYPPFCFLNHSDKANARLYRGIDGKFYLSVLKSIAADAEVTINYDQMEM